MSGESKIPQVIRYPKRIRLVVNLSSVGNEKLELPYLEIDYRERQLQYSIGSANSLSDVTFASEYIFSTETFWKGATAFFWILFGVMILILLVTTVVLTQNPQLTGQQNAAFGYWIVKSLFNLLDLFSYLYFWYIFALTGYWFVFFKLQERVYCFLPAPDSWQTNFLPYDWLFTWVAGSKLLFVTFRIVFEQTSWNIFVIDWERPKYQEHKTSGDIDPRVKFDVNAWRHIFLVNELNEL